MEDSRMSAYKVSVEIEGRIVDSIVKEGVLATIETGTLLNSVETPKHKVVIMVGRATGGPSAWIQVSHYNGGGHPQIAYEGWVKKSGDRIQALAGSSSIAASLVEEVSPSAEVTNCHANAEFGTLSCCTSNGNGCYVRCCNGCCSDPVGCPGASCCG
jgi:hypothetical protein